MYNKLFAKILDSSIWLEPDPIRLVWITLLAAMDQDGYAHFSAVKNLADRAKVSLDDTQKAIDKLMAPDPESGIQEHEGRRLERVPGGFIILNAKHYKDLVSREIQRENTRERVRRFREKQANVTQRNDFVTPSDTDTNTETKKKIGQQADRFPEFWFVYPRKVKKQDAVKVWKSRKLDQIADMIIDDVKARQAEDGRWLGGFIPDPTTYLRGARWDDEFSEPDKRATK